MIDGWCDPAFQHVRDAFEASFADAGREQGAAFAAVVDGRLVVDLSVLEVIG